MAHRKPITRSEPPAFVRAQRPHLALDVNRSNHSIDELDAQLSWQHHIDSGLLKVR